MFALSDSDPATPDLKRDYLREQIARYGEFLDRAHKRVHEREQAADRLTCEDSE